MKKAVYLERYEWGYVAEAMERAATANPSDCTITHVGRHEIRRIAKILRDASIEPTPKSAEEPRLDVELCRYETRIMSHAEWRALHPTEHPLWCLHAMTGKLEPCDCDLAYPESMQPQSETGED
jgi:hypothetical protein